MILQYVIIMTEVHVYQCGGGGMIAITQYQIKSRTIIIGIGVQ